MNIFRNNIKNALVKSGYLILICTTAYLIYYAFISFNEDNPKRLILLQVPLLSGFIHEGNLHLLINLFLFFLFMLADENQPYSISKIYWLTVLISTLYLPFSLSGIALPSIGLSGICYFFMARFFWDWQYNKYIGKMITLIFSLIELFSMNANTDKTAHGIQLIGIFVGIISLKPNLIKFMPKWLANQLYAI